MYSHYSQSPYKIKGEIMTNEVNSDDQYIERSFHTGNYTIIPNEILQDSSMSSNATMILVYLLSCKSDWNIKPKNIWKSKNISRDHVYEAFNELIDLGYMQKTVTMKGNLKNVVRYKVSDYKKFTPSKNDNDDENLKKCFRRPEPRDTEPRDPGAQDAYKSNIYIKETCVKKDNVLTLPSSKERKNFKFYLSPEQLKMHDKLVKYQPEHGEPLESNTVCAWFLDKKYSVQQVEIAFKVYQQDARKGCLNGHHVKNMGGLMVSVINSKRMPENEDISFNKEFAEKLSKKYRFLEMTKKYVKVLIGMDSESIMFNLPRNAFTFQLENFVRRAEIYSFT